MGGGKECLGGGEGGSNYEKSDAIGYRLSTATVGGVFLSLLVQAPCVLLTLSVHDHTFSGKRFFFKLIFF